MACWLLRTADADINKEGFIPSPPFSRVHTAFLRALLHFAAYLSSLCSFKGVVPS